MDIQQNILAFLANAEQPTIAAGVVPNQFQYALQRLYSPDGKSRVYYLQDDPQKRFFLGCTTFCAAVLPQSNVLTQYRITQAVTVGVEMAQIEFELSAIYGTVYHIILAYFVREVMILENWQIKDVRAICEDVAEAYLQQNYPLFKKRFLADYAHKLHKNVNCFLQWAVDVNLRPIASEYRVVDFENGIAGTIDLVAQITQNGKTETFIIDFKSSEKGVFYDSHKLQLAFLRHAWNETAAVGGFDKIEKVGNFSPKDYRKETPTYTFECSEKDYAEYIDALPHYFALCKIHKTIENALPKAEKIAWENGKPEYLQLQNSFTIQK